MTASVLSSPESSADKKVSSSAQCHNSLPMANGTNDLVGQLTSLYSDVHKKVNFTILNYCHQNAV